MGLTSIGVDAKATKLDFVAIEDTWVPAFEPPWTSGNVVHQIMYSSHLLHGTLDNKPLIGFTTATLDFKVNSVTGIMWGHGTAVFAFAWDKLYGTFEGVINFRMDADGISGQFTLHGTGNYKGWKLFGSISSAGSDNALNGIVLQPN